MRIIVYTRYFSIYPATDIFGDSSPKTNPLNLYATIRINSYQLFLSPFCSRPSCFPKELMDMGVGNFSEK